MSQSKKASLTEAVVSTLVGLVVAWFAQALICWAHNIPLSPGNNAIIVFWMTVLSVIRTYVFRRIFNKKALVEEYFESGIRNNG
jgi:hypothetical protein